MSNNTPNRPKVCEGVYREAEAEFDRAVKALIAKANSPSA